MEAVILAAGLGKRLLPYTIDNQKGLLEVGGMSILQRQISLLKRHNVKRVHVVVGHAADRVIYKLKGDPALNFIYNSEFGSANVIMSIMTALPYLTDDFICLCGDCVFEDRIMDKFLMGRQGIVLAVDRNVVLDEEAMKVCIQGEFITGIGKNLDKHLCHGEFIGLGAFNGSDAQVFKDYVVQCVISGHKNMFWGDILHKLINEEGIPVYLSDISGYLWCEIDSESDLLIARSLFCCAEQAGLINT